MTRSDPVGTEFYLPLRRAELWSDISFVAAAVLSLVALQIDKANSPRIYDAAQSLFALSVISVFIAGIAIRLYLSTRAHTKRAADFVSNAFDIALIPRTSSEYYNNAETEPFRRMAASLLENAFFSKCILQQMLHHERLRIVIYGVLWLLALLNRATDLALITAVAQVIFSEQIISKWLRMEWLRARAERVYDDVYSLIQSYQKSGAKEFKARVIECLLRYETGKAQAGISISTRLFNKMNSSLSAQWSEMADRLRV
jgi:hypothetical protein